MVRRLVEVNYFENRGNPSEEQMKFWFLALRTPKLLIELATHTRIPPQLSRQRPLLNTLKLEDESILAKRLIEEEEKEREADRHYWRPLKKELEA